MTRSYGKLYYCALNQCFLGSAPFRIATSASRRSRRHLDIASPLMRLVSCATPPEPLEEAPRTALLADLTEGERWDGFWSADAYYVRCTKDAGDVAWFRLADDVAPAQSGARVLAL